MPNPQSSNALAKRAREIAEALGGTWSGSKGMCRCPAHDDRTPSLSIRLGRRAILVHCFAGCSNEAVIEGLARLAIKPAQLFDGQGDPIVAMPRAEAADRNALRLWRGASILKDSPASAYLAHRGIAFACADLRYHPRTPFGPKDAVRFLPAMLAAVRNDLGILAVHRTFLDATTGKLAAFDRPKRALGSLGTGAVRLAVPRGGSLGLAEGIESALSAQTLFGIACWATLGNERFGLVTIPESVRELHLFVDSDAGGALAEARARSCYSREDLRIVTQRPAIAGQDWNDVLAAHQPAFA